MMKKCFVSAAIVLFLLLTVCAFAQAQEDTITLKIKAIDNYTKQPLPNVSLRLYHLECQREYHQVYGGCDCFSEGSDYIQNIFGGHSPCSYCGGTHLSGLENMQDTTNLGSFELIPGHEYALTDSWPDDYLHHLPIFISTDPDTRKIFVETENENIRLINGNELEIGFEIGFEPTHFEFSATKLMDGKDPGSQKFAFKVWELSDEQIEECLDFYNMLLPEEFPPYKEEYDELDDIELINTAFTPEHFKLVIERMRAKLDQYPYTIIYSDGKKVPFIDETCTVYDIWETRAEKKNFVISEVIEPDKPICYDPSIYTFSLEYRAFYLTTPISLDLSSSERKIDAGTFVQGITKVPLEITYAHASGISPEYGITQLDLNNDTFTPEDVSDYMVFRNRTCPFASSASDDDLPQTGDNSNLVLFAVLAAVSAICMTIILHRKNEA